MPNSNFKFENGVIHIKINNEWITPEISSHTDLEQVGQAGANGVVFKGVHRITQRKDAIKIWLPRDRSKNGTVRENQYLAEIQKIASLNHPNIARIFDAKIENNCYFCVMELIDGITFKEWLRNNTDLSKRIKIMKEVFQTRLLA